MNKNQFSLSFLILLAGVVAKTNLAAVGVPLTDVILYGRVWDKQGSQRLDSLMPNERIVVAANGVQDENGNKIVLGQADKLLGVDGQIPSFYVIRLNRFDGVTALSDRDYVVSGDSIRIYLEDGDDSDGDGDPLDADEEVIESSLGSILITSAQHQVNHLNLNTPESLLDADNDGLPDAWEEMFLSGTGQGSDDDASGDGVSNFFSWAFGLNPNVDNSSELPFLAMENDGNLSFFYRRSASEVGLTYSVQAADEIGDPEWTTLQLIPVEIGSDASSRLLKVTVPEGVDRNFRFFRLVVN